MLLPILGPPTYGKSHVARLSKPVEEGCLPCSWLVSIESLERKDGKKVPLGYKAANEVQAT